jgi:hypothetical protein
MNAIQTKFERAERAKQKMQAAGEHLFFLKPPQKGDHERKRVIYSE